MANYVLVHQKVRDFAQWKTGFDAHKSIRDAAGLTGAKVFHSANDPNDVFLLLTASDLKRAKQFTDSAELREVMQKAGVVDRPDTYFLTD